MRIYESIVVGVFGQVACVEYDHAGSVPLPAPTAHDQGRRSMIVGPPAITARLQSGRRRYRWSVGQYEDARDEAHNAMREVARKRATITYGQLVSHVHSWELDPHGEVLARILDEISTEEHHQGRGTLSAVVIHATDDYLPGPGFFKLANKLGHDASDKVAFHAAELRRVHDAFAAGPLRD